MFPELEYRILNRVRSHLSDEPVIAYIGEADSWPCLVVAPTKDQFDIIRIEETNGPIIGIETGDILDEFLVIDEKYGVDIIGADDRAVEFKIKRQLQGIEKVEFSQWLAIFADEAVWSSNFDIKQPVVMCWD
jgi:hypothetical protein